MRPYPLYLSRKGFTLLEVVLAISISALLLASALLSLRLGIKAWEKGERGSMDASLRRSVTDMLTKEIGSAYPYVQTGGQGTGYIFKGERESLCFVTSSRRGAASLPWGGSTLLCYLANEKGLILREMTVPLQEIDFNGQKGGKEVELWPKAGVSFEYLGGNGWEGEWDGAVKKALPLAIKTTLLPNGGKRGLELVIPVNAGRAEESPGLDAVIEGG